VPDSAREDFQPPEGYNTAQNVESSTEKAEVHLEVKEYNTPENIQTSTEKAQEYNTPENIQTSTQKVEEYISPQNQTGY
jgi:hypothetical protein